MNAVHDNAPPPILAIAGGAGAMGSLFAELLLPALRCCLLIDRFGADDHRGDETPVALAPLVERLTAGLTRQGLEVRLLAGHRSGVAAPAPISGRDVRLAPAWLLARSQEAQEAWPDQAELAGGPAAVAERMRQHPELRCVVGFLTPDDAAAAARTCDILMIATHYQDDEQFGLLLAPYAAAIRTGSLVTDLLSIKEAPVRALCRHFPPAVGVLGMHPLFGRMPVDVTGLVVAVVPAPDGRPSVAGQRWLLEQLAQRGMLITPTGGAEHDAAMGYVQALTHFALLCFAYTFVRANQDPTLLLPFRTPVFEPLLYLAARVASLAQRTPEVYRAIQAECTRPELRRLFVATAQELLTAIDSDTGLVAMFETLGAPWTPAYHRDAEAFEQLVTMSSALTEPINALRHALLRSAGQVRGIRNTRTGAVTLGMVYIDPLHHDRVDLASRLRYRRFNLTAGTLDGEAQGDTADRPDVDRQRIEAALGSLPLAQVQLLSETEMLTWLNTHAGPRAGPDDYRGVDRNTIPLGNPRQRLRYVGKAHFDLSLEVPAWFDDDSLSRLLLGRHSGRATLAVAQLVSQDAGGIRVAAGRRAATVRIVTLLPPQEVMALRATAEQEEPSGQPRTGWPEWRRLTDRRFAALVIKHQTEARQATLDWLLAHGCAVLRRA